MATQINPATLPPFDEYALTGIWISTMLYGINVILYALCMYILIRKQNEARKQWPLLATSTILYFLASLHIGASLKQLIDAFVDGPKTGNPYAGLLYWLNFTSPTQRIKGYTYTFIDLVLVWRLYVVWGNNWMIALLPFLTEIAHFGLAVYETDKSANGIPFSSKLPIVAYVLVIIVNVGCTVGIAGRLWYMGRQHGSSGTGGSGSGSASWSTSGSWAKNRYMAPIFTIVESGAIFTLSSIVLLGMFANNDARLETSVNVATQLACLTPLLIIVRVGFGLTHGAGGITQHQQKQKRNARTLTNPNVSFGRATGLTSRGLTSTNGGTTTTTTTSGGGGAAVSTINVFRTVETETSLSSSAHTPLGTYKDDGDDYVLDEFKGPLTSPSSFGRTYSGHSEDV